MRSLAAAHRKDLETRGEYVVTANAASGWFAIFLGTWHDRIAKATSDGRPGPNLVVCRTKSADGRDHYVIPYFAIREILVEETMTTSKINGSQRWNLTLKDGLLHVSHRTGALDVSSYHGAHLITEGAQETPLPRVQPLAEELDPSTPIREGAKHQIVINAYERNPIARAHCVAHYGSTCVVCGVSFGSLYGPVAEGFIHVHHIRPLSEAVGEYEVDPILDLRPVCPNCHSVIHLDGGCRTIEEVRQLLDERTRAPSQ